MAFKMKGPSLLKMVSALKTDKTPGSQNRNFPEIVYTIDGKAVKSTSIDEGQLDLNPSIDPKLRRFVNYTEDDGTKTRYYYKNPAPDQAKFSDLEKSDDDQG